MSRFYSWNKNASIVYGNQNRLILNGKKDLEFFTPDKEKYLKMFSERPAYAMLQYDINDKTIQCLLDYSFYGSYFDTLYLMCLEHMDYVAMTDAIVNYSKLYVYYPESYEFKKIMDNE